MQNQFLYFHQHKLFQKRFFLKLTNYNTTRLGQYLFLLTVNFYAANADGTTSPTKCEVVGSSPTFPIFYDGK